jgi:ATP/maltotriose-dependent transcriptional regulator MalT
LTGADAVKFYNFRALFLYCLAETQALAGSLDEAILTIEKALETNPDEKLFDPMVFTLRGDLRLRNDPNQAELAEQDFREGIKLSQNMSAKSLELRATTSLAGLLRDTGRRDEARVMLAEIYGWFTEGFDTLDLREAKALLDELDGGGATE